MSHELDFEQPMLSLERRTRVRYVPPADTECIANHGNEPGTIALILDISSGGLSMVLHRAFDMGSTLICEVGNRCLVARVVHIRSEGDCFIHGCEFDRPLADSEVERLL